MEGLSKTRESEKINENPRSRRILLALILAICLLSPLVGFLTTLLFNMQFDAESSFSYHVVVYIFLGIVSFLCLVVTIFVLLLTVSMIICLSHQLYSIYTNYKVYREEQTRIAKQEKQPLL